MLLILFTARRPVENDDLVLVILNGLGPEYDPIVSSVANKVDPMQYDDVVDLLLGQEQRLSSLLIMLLRK